MTTVDAWAEPAEYPKPPLLHLCLGHLEQYYRDDLKRNPQRLAWMLKKGIVVKTVDGELSCDWCKLGMPKFI